MSLLHSNLNKTKVTVRTETPEVTYLTTSADEARIAIIANSCNFAISSDHTSNTNQHIYYLGTSTLHQNVYIAYDNSNNSIIKLATFAQDGILFDANTTIEGSLLPTSNAEFTIGNPVNKWHNLYLNSNLYFGDTLIQYDTSNNELAFKQYYQQKVEPISYSITTSNLIDTSNITTLYKYIQITETSNILVTSNIITITTSLETSNIPQTSNNIITLPEKYQPIKGKHLSLYNPDGARVLFQTSEQGTFLTSYSSEGDIISDINLTNFSTTSVAEDPNGSNLYFTDERVMEVINNITNQSAGSITSTSNQLSSFIRETSNIFASDLTSISSNAISAINQYTTIHLQDIEISTSNIHEYITSTSNILQATIKNTSNTIASAILQKDPFIMDYLKETSNIAIQTLQQSSNNVITVLTATDADTSNYIKETSNSLASNLILTSNAITDVLNTTYIINACNITDTSNYFYSSITTSSNILESFLSSTLSNILSYTDITSNDLVNQMTNQSTTLTTTLENTNSNMLDYINQVNTTLDQSISSYSSDINTQLNSIDLKDISQTASRKVIVNSIYDNDLTVSNLTVEGHVLPAEDLKYNLGAPDKRWKDLYLTGSTIYLDNVKMSANSVTGGLTVQNTTTNKYADIITSKIVLKDTSTQELVQLTSSGNQVTIGSYTATTNTELPSASTIQKVYTTSSIVELPGASNLYYTPERAGAIAYASNLEVIAYNQRTSNEISTRINNLTADQIQNGTSNQFIVNGVFSCNLIIAGTLTVSNLEVIGSSASITTSTYQTEKLKISTLAADGPALTVIQDGLTCNVAEFYKNSSKVFSVTNQGNVGIGTIIPTERLDVDGNIRFSTSINNITAAELSYLSGVTSPIQQQINDINKDTSNYTSNIYVGFISILSSTSNAIHSAILTSNTNMISFYQRSSNSFASNLVNTSNNLANYYITLGSNITSNLNANISNIFNTAIPNIRDIILTTRITTFDSNQQSYFGISSNSVQRNISTTSNALTAQISSMAATGWQNFPTVTQTYNITNSGFQYNVDGVAAASLTLRNGNTYAFRLSLESSHPFQIRVSNGGSAIIDGMVHIDTNGTMTVGAAANNGRTAGILYWTVPISGISSAVYQCTAHASMVGNITLNTTGPLINTLNIYINSNIGIGTSIPTERLDVVGNIRLSSASSTINNITATEISYLNGVASNIQQQIIATGSNLLRYTSNMSNLFIPFLANMSNTISPIITRMNSNIYDYIRITSNAFEADLRTTSNNLSAMISPFIGAGYTSSWSNSGANIYYSSNVGIGTSIIETSNILEIVGGDLNITNGNLERTIVGYDSSTAVNSAIWYQFNQIPTAGAILNDSNTTLNSVKYNMNINGNFDVKHPKSNLVTQSLVRYYISSDDGNTQASAFDSGWASANSTYSSSTGNAITTTLFFNNDTNFCGEYIIIDIYEEIDLTKYRIYPVNNNTDKAPKKFRIYATNDASSFANAFSGGTKTGNWVQLDEKSNVAYVNNDFNEFNVNVSVPQAYRFYAFIVNQVNAPSTNTQIGKIELYTQTLSQVTGYTLNSYAYTNAYLWNGSNITNDNVHLTYNGSPNNIQSLLNAFHMNSGLSIHFVIDTSYYIAASPPAYTSHILFINNTNGDLIRVYIIDDQLYFKVGSAIVNTTISANTSTQTSTPYVVDITWTYALGGNMTLRIYRNGVLVATNSSTAYNNLLLNVDITSLVYYIGRANDNNDGTPIMLQDFRIYSRVLTTSQITSLQSGNSLGPTLGSITETYQLERWKDSSTYNNSDGTKFIYYDTGYVGIGKAPLVNLHVTADNATLTSNMRYFDISNNITFQNTKTITDVCAIFDSSIWCKSVIAASSDIRIKKDIEDVDDHTALDMIMSIEPKTYNYIDPNKGTEKVYGFLAQQIRQVIPEAVQIRKDIIPNIFAVAFTDGNMLKFNGNINVNNYASFINSKLCIVYMSGQYDTVIITGIDTEGNAIVIDKVLSIGEPKVFVYGTEINDFHALDKAYIFTLNVCATQILSQQIDDLEKEIIALENQLNIN